MTVLADNLNLVTPAPRRLGSLRITPENWRRALVLQLLAIIVAVVFIGASFIAIKIDENTLDQRQAEAAAIRVPNDGQLRVQEYEHLAAIFAAIDARRVHGIDPFARVHDLAELVPPGMNIISVHPAQDDNSQLDVTGAVTSGPVFDVAKRNFTKAHYHFTTTKVAADNGFSARVSHE